MRCLKAVRTCYCHVLKPFKSPVPFVILQQFDEARNAIATARMAHLSIENSRIITGYHFGEDAEVNALLADATQRHMLLYPGPEATPLAELDWQDERPLTFWVLDAKWSQVPKMMRMSPNLRAMPMVSLAVEEKSLFSSIRMQPDAMCLSTIEAMFLVIDQVKKVRGLAGDEHQALLDVFRHMLAQQLGFVRADDNRHGAARALRELRKAAKARGISCP